MNTQEEKRIKIAEACGWRCQKHVAEEDKATALMCWIAPGRDEWQPSLPPDYFNDLNAMHEAEKQLKGDQWVAYVRLLGEVTQEDKGRCHATSSQRAEAFGLTLNLWKA